MKLYRIVAEREGKLSGVWVGTQSDAGKARKTFVEDGFKRAEITTQEVDVPTNKEGLINFLNSLEN